MNLTTLAEQYPVVAEMVREQASSAAREAQLRREHAELLSENIDLKAQLDWFKRQLFGERSERRLALDDPRQLSLGETLSAEVPAATETVKSYERRVRPPREEAADAETLLRFNESVPVETIEVLPDEVREQCVRRPGSCPQFGNGVFALPGLEWGGALLMFR